MQSFRTELENPVVEKDIIDLEQKIRAFREGKIHDEKFRSLRLARGVYGQRQPGVQMVRIKLPFGKVTFKQLLRIADVSDEYGSGNLHLTTRQDIQIHYVSLDRTPQLWAELERDDITLREACGNTVRNVTSSPDAGINPDELFDVSPYAQATFAYFLRNPVCQEMGRKIKISFSANAKDTAFSYIHDLGFIPKLDDQGNRGFKVMFAGGLGAQPFLASVVKTFLPEDQLIPYTESVLRVFDRYGERSNRNKARMKYLVQKLGLEEVTRLIEEEVIANKSRTYPINRDLVPLPDAPPEIALDAELKPADPVHYQQWLDTNVFQQKQAGFYGVYLKIPVGDIKTDRARLLVEAIRPYVADEIRITQNQGLLLKFVRANGLLPLYNNLLELGFAVSGFDSLADVTTCPGTDTCNLGIANSMSLAVVLETVIQDEFPDLIYDKDIKIKISGCMNSCGQHGLAHIGFHGSSVKANGQVVPAVQVMLGGGTVGDGEGRVAERVIKVPTKRAQYVLRTILEDYQLHAAGKSFHEYYDFSGKDYFYQLLKPLADLTTLTPEEYVDWGHEETFQTAIGVGECAGVIVDLVATLLFEGEEKLLWAREAFEAGAWSDAIYHAYSVYVNTAKALLLDKGISASTQIGVIREFDTNFVITGEVKLEGTFSDLVLQINKNEPGVEFAAAYLKGAGEFYQELRAKREAQVKA